jgi:hypothetical protein
LGQPGGEIRALETILDYFVVAAPVLIQVTFLVAGDMEERGESRDFVLFCGEFGRGG